MEMSDNKTKFKLIELDQNEKIVCEIRKHPLGYIGIYTIGIIVSLSAIIFSIFLSASVEDNIAGVNLSEMNASLLVTVFGAIVGVFIMIISLISAHLYRQDFLLVTSDKIVQCINNSLFNKKVSQLKIIDAQDVTVLQAGILAKAFNFGTIVIETAGEQTNYTFTYVPNPYERAKEIMSVQEAIKN